MKFHIREWSENTIVLMTESGHVLAYYLSVSEALSVCEEWYNCNQSEQKLEVMVKYKQEDSSYMPANIIPAAIRSEETVYV